MEVIYFELNNWSPGNDYPAEEPFLDWMHNDLEIAFNNEKWCVENKLCVNKSIIDMSQNYCITATKEWVEENCPSLLTKYTEFLRYPDKWGDVEGRFGCPFLEYKPYNFGISWHEEDWLDKHDDWIGDSYDDEDDREGE